MLGIDWDLDGNVDIIDDLITLEMQDYNGTLSKRWAVL